MKSAYEDLSGGYCSGVPPLPIPNREVKPACADGTAMQCGRVGGRHFYSQSPESEMIQGSFRLVYLVIWCNKYFYVGYNERKQFWNPGNLSLGTGYVG